MCNKISFAFQYSGKLIQQYKILTSLFFSPEEEEKLLPEICKRVIYPVSSNSTNKKDRTQSNNSKLVGKKNIYSNPRR